jgi:hypothetical protein
MDGEDSRVAALSHQSAKRAFPDADLTSDVPVDADAIHLSKRTRRKPKKATGSSVQAPTLGSSDNLKDKGRGPVTIPFITRCSSPCSFCPMSLVILF